VAVSPDARWIASAGADRLVRLWNAETRTLTSSLVGHQGRVTSVEFSADGSLLASAGEDQSVRLWEIPGGRELAKLSGHDGSVRSVRFAPGRATLASGGDDGTIRLWAMDDLRRPAPEILARIEQQFGMELAGTRVVERAAHSR
jgi:WD40 repeat protein